MPAEAKEVKRADGEGDHCVAKQIRRFEIGGQETPGAGVRKPSEKAGQKTAVGSFEEVLRGAIDARKKLARLPIDEEHEGSRKPVANDRRRKSGRQEKGGSDERGYTD